MDIIRTDKVTKTYDTRRALDSVTLDIKRGEAVALIGVNGSGKTTLINTILGFTSHDGSPNSGNSYIMGIESGKICSNIRQQIACISDATTPMPWARLGELASFYKKIYSNWDEKRFEELIHQWDLRRTRRLTEMSKGQKRLSEFALVLATKPEILFLDEPFNELDPQHRNDLADILSRERLERKLTLLYSTHALGEISQIAHRLLMMKEGKLVLDCEIEDLDISINETFIHYNQRAF